MTRDNVKYEATIRLTMELVARDRSVGRLVPERRRYPGAASDGGAAAAEEYDVVPDPRPSSVGAAIRAHLTSQAVPAAMNAAFGWRIAQGRVILNAV